MNYPNNTIYEFIKSKDINLITNSIGINHYNCDYTFGPHIHSTVEVNYVKQGTCYMKIDNDIVHYQINDCMILYPNVLHYFWVDNPKGCTLVQLDFKLSNFPQLLIEDSLEDYLIFLYDIVTNSRKYIKVFDSFRIQSCMERLIEECSCQSEESNLLKKLYYSELFIILSSKIKSAMLGITSSKNAYVEYCLKYINSNYSENISIDELSKGCGITSRYLLEVFSSQTGFSIIDYITCVRISKAKEMLKNGDFNITEIALNVGYSTPQYFNRIFKNKTGITPGSYRKLLFRKV